MNWLIELFSSSGFGGIVGFIGSYFTRREERKLLESKQMHELNMRSYDFQELELSQNHELKVADKNLERAKVEGNIEIEGKEINAFLESVKSQAKQVGVVFVDAIRGLMRPVITIYLMLTTTIIAYKVGNRLDGLDGLPVDEMYSLYREIILQLVCLTAIAIGWWFGSRPTRQSENNTYVK